MAKHSINRYALTFLFLLLPTLLFASAPSRSKTYTTGQIISASDVTENEDNIFGYLQRGVDTLASSCVTSSNITDGTIVNADISGSAAITYSKLSLTGGITNTDISSTAAIADSKLATISTSGKVNPSAVTGGNLDVGDYEVRGKTLQSDVTTGTAPMTITSTTVVTNLNADLLDGISSANFSQKELFTSSGTFTAPTGVTQVYVTMVGGGGGGGACTSTVNAAGGGGGGESYVKYPYTTIGGNNYDVTVGAAGTGGAAGDNNGTAGENTTFGTGTVITASGGAGGSKGTVHTGGAGGGGLNGGNGSGVSAGAAGDSLGGGTGGTGATANSGGGGGGGSLFGKGGVGGEDTNGSTATGYGAGGGGGGTSGAATKTGGNGTAGFVLVEW